MLMIADLVFFLSDQISDAFWKKEWKLGDAFGVCARMRSTVIAMPPPCPWKRSDVAGHDNRDTPARPISWAGGARRLCIHSEFGHLQGKNVRRGLGERKVELGGSARLDRCRRRLERIADGTNGDCRKRRERAGLAESCTALARLVLTETMMVDPGCLALTTTPSIFPSSVEDTVPVSAAGPWLCAIAGWLPAIGKASRPALRHCAKGQSRKNVSKSRDGRHRILPRPAQQFHFHLNDLGRQEQEICAGGA